MEEQTMGAQFISFAIPATQDPLKAFAGRRRADLHEYGHDPYSGTFGAIPGLTVTGCRFGTGAEAVLYCEEYAGKWENALAVRFTDEGQEWWLIAGWAPC
jgi:hypothetical protein